jgi:hypothetical protein
MKDEGQRGARMKDEGQDEDEDERGGERDKDGARRSSLA